MKTYMLNLHFTEETDFLIDGLILELEKIANNKRVNDDKDSKSEFVDYIVSDKTDNALSVMQQQEIDDDLILNIFSIIESQKKVNTTDLKKIPTKICMYDAFIETLKEKLTRIRLSPYIPL
jgi:hypothetical protein